MNEMSIEQLRWKKYPVLNDGHICLVDVMGDDAAIVQAARISYGKDEKRGDFQELFLDVEGVSDQAICERGCIIEKVLGSARFIVRVPDEVAMSNLEELWGHAVWSQVNKPVDDKDRNLIRYLLAHGHTTPFEMVEFKFRVRVPMDCWRQWVRHRTANINEYSTRYSEAIDSFQTTKPTEWRLQASNNKQGSEGFLEASLPTESDGTRPVDGIQLSGHEACYLSNAKALYKERLAAGVAKEQARKDLPLSTYTEAYWKCDLHNIFNFLRLRMDSHAQYEIRMYANAMAEIVKQVVPVAWEAFEDYILYAKRFSRMEMEILHEMYLQLQHYHKMHTRQPEQKPDSMTQREWKEFMEKLT